MRKFLTVFLLITIVTTTAYAIKFTDVPSSAWYNADLNSVLTDSRMLITGYPDGTFKPDVVFSVEQFAVVMVKASGVTDIKASGTYWATPWVNKAKELGYIKTGEFNDTSKPITRGEMARIIIRFTESHEKNEYTDPTGLKKSIKDYSKIDSALQSFVVKVYDLGIIGGYPDGTFGADKSLKRSEAVAVVNKIVFPSKRNSVKIDYTKLTSIPITEAIDLEALSVEQKSIFKNLTSYESNLVQLGIDLKFKGFNRGYYSFEYNAKKGLSPMYAVDNTGIYHLGDAGGYPIGTAVFGQDDGKGSVVGKTIIKLVLINTNTGQVVVVPCEYKLEK